MKLSLILSLATTSWLLVACIGAPVPATEPAAATLTPSPPTETSIPTELPPPTVSPIPTNTPSPTDTPIPTDTPAPPPSDTPAPPPTAVAEPSSTPMPTPTLTLTFTSTLEIVAPLTLLTPADGDTFASAISRPTFGWSEAPRPLADDEYYVLIITHKQGRDFIWTKQPTYTAGDDKPWWIDYGPTLLWQVVTARKRTNEPSEDPTGNETGAYSVTRSFYWDK